MIVLLLILLSIPFMQAALYKPSLEIIRSIQPYYTTERTEIMNFFSAIGDGEGFFHLNAIFFAIGLHYEFAFLTMAFCANVHIIAFLKTLLQHSRPQFDDPTIGVVSNSSICSGEFGNPSGHATMTT
jgi:membrane-associated phospholipid phosphatase